MEDETERWKISHKDERKAPTLKAGRIKTDQESVSNADRDKADQRRKGGDGRGWIGQRQEEIDSEEIECGIQFKISRTDALIRAKKV